MNEIIIQAENQTENLTLSFIDILLNEKLLAGTIYVPFDCLKQVSTLNNRLPAYDKQIYDFLLRLSLIFPVYISQKPPEKLDSYFKIENICEPVYNEAGLQCDCYIIARYKKILLEQKLFDSAISSILAIAQQLECQERIVLYLENMLRENDIYQYFYLGSQPFLIYTGEETCYHILSVFAECLGNALCDKGYLVEYFDISKEAVMDVVKYINQSYQAVIGIQCCMFSVYLENGSLLHDKIIGPKYNFILDHPVYVQHYFKDIPKTYTIFTLDLNYASYVEQNYPFQARFLPPGGIEKPFLNKPRIYDLTFIGSYANHAEDVSVQLKLLTRSMRFLVNRLWLNMRKYPNLSAEQSLWLALNHYGQALSDAEFKELFFNLRIFVWYMSYHYRYKILKTIVYSGIQIHVFGEDWKSCPLRRHPNFIWHKNNLTTDECLEIWQKSKIALNIMSWHKNAITERIINSMLQKAVVLTEKNPYLENQFEDGQDIMYYELDHLEKLPKIISSLLESEQELTEIGERGYKKALKKHTWCYRADEMLDIIRQDSAAMYHVKL